MLFGDRVLTISTVRRGHRPRWAANREDGVVVRPGRNVRRHRMTDDPAAALAEVLSGVLDLGGAA
ncbi:hypothetical protein [Saccharopolyspora mangrovi]|uniref:Uncharacterized protein n=1 Tax=Saccharopolyspora mangrovi TaxID=3082379 RepID=A0ABU6AEJ7_9PSEU|nr:hypothetical protein [Saccharopolyspora sp. S2-29]MEB3369966.1 hypothetical protein [Saccharopolyspora sp. S2-29]